LDVFIVIIYFLFEHFAIKIILIRGSQIFKKFWELPQNSRCQKGYMKQVP